MFNIKQLCCTGLLYGYLIALGSWVEGQDAGSNAGQLWKDARAMFASGDYTHSAGNLEAIIHSSATAATWLDNKTVPEAPPNQQWMEPVFFMLGACHFNAKDWPNAILIFEKYRQLFPKSARLNQVIYSLAQANLLGGHAGDAIPLLSSLLAVPDYHERALLLLFDATNSAGKPADAVALLEKEKTTPNVDPAFLEKMNVKLFPLYLSGGQDEKAVQLLQQMDEDMAHVQDVTEFNAMAVRLGDSFLAKKNIEAAISAYRRVRDNAQIIELQKQQIESLQRQIAVNSAGIQANPLNSSQLQLDNKDLQNQITKDEKVLAQYQTLPPVLPPLLLRIARAYSEDGRLWESAVVYREIMRRYPQAGELEAALYGSIVVFDRLKQNDRAQTLSQTYLTQFPKGKYADSVGFLRGALAYDAQDFDKAISYFKDSLKNQPTNPRREQTELILGDINLRQQKFDDAIAAYKQYQTDFPAGTFLEQAEYRTDLALLFSGKSEEADKAIRAYIQKYPAGAYVADAEYRLAVIKFAAKEYDEAITDCIAWQQKHGTAGPLAEVLSLMGDCYSSEDKNEEAVDLYIRSYKAASTVEVLNYSIFAAAKILQKQAKWTDIVNLFQGFIKANPEHPTVVSAIVWIGRADIKLGKAEEAKQFMAATAKQYLNDPDREAVDEIITQLAQQFARKSFAALVPVVPVAPGTAAFSASTTPTTAPTTPLTSTPANLSVAEEPAKGLEEILTIPDLDSKPTARARILFAQAELARLQRKPGVEKQILLDIAKKFKPEDLSPILLGQTGDCLVQDGQLTQAEPFFNYLLDQYDHSPLLDYAYNGLGAIAYLQKDYAKAEKYYAKALDKGIASSKLKEITLGEAQSLLALNRPADAKPLFEQVASTRAWRGEATALSVYSLGEIQMDLGKFAEANAYYQRVFVAYQKYPAIQAKAYLKSGEAFEKLGKIPEAMNTYSEMLKNPSLLPFPESADAKQRLEHLAQK